MAVLVGSKQLAGMQGNKAQGNVTVVMFSLPEEDDQVRANAHHTLDTLGLTAVVEAPAGGQRLLLASARGQRLNGVDVIGQIMREYSLELLKHGTRSPKVALWPRLLRSLLVGSSGQPILRPVSRWDEARRDLLSCANARALAGGLVCLQEA